MQQVLRIFMAQINFLMGDIDGNTEKIMAACQQAKQQGGDIILFSELALTGYPPEDLLLRPGLQKRVEQSITTIKEKINDIHVIVGHPLYKKQHLYNGASVLYQGELIADYEKHCLPNYSVFDEKRYFSAKKNSCLITVKNINIAITICEDLWQAAPMKLAAEAGAQLMLCLNASPFNFKKPKQRQQILQQRIKEHPMPILYCNQVGGQDELVFDGGSMALNQQGDICVQADYFQEDLVACDITIKDKQLILNKGKQLPPHTKLQHIYQALVLGVRDYVQKNGFNGALIGLSGGIDSALTLAVAVDALGPEQVHGVLMPSRHTAKMSVDDAAQQAKTMGAKHSIIPIESTFTAFLDSLADEFQGYDMDTTEENLQARCRGVMLMAMSNKFFKMVLTTGNKSEMAVGYATLYGDMAGGFAVLKDIPKTLVYQLANYRNSISAVIPQRVIDRAPSAELAPDQVDQDSLPDYDTLDEIIERYVEKDEGIYAITAASFDPDLVKKVIRLIDTNEYKRRQAPPGVRITERAFGRDRRYPITSAYTRHLKPSHKEKDHEKN